ncbi:hypothetical protein Tco_1320250 [Tanacetum coccineum]
MKEIFKQMEKEVDQNAVDKQCAEIERKNILIENENLIANCLSNQLLYAIEQSRCLDLEAEIFNLQLENQKDVHNEMIKSFNKLEASPEFDSFFKINKLKEQLQGKDNTIRNLKIQVSKMNDKRSEEDSTKDAKALESHNLEITENVTALHEQNERFRAENEKVKQHYMELYNSIKITRVNTNEKTSSLLTEIVNLKAKLKGKMLCITMDSVKPKVLAPEARIAKPLDNAFQSACLYTKRSQELLEYVFGTCPIEFNKRDNKAATTPLTRKQQVTFNDTCGTSTNNTQKHVVQQKVHQSNVHVIPSIGVNSSTEASGSKPRRNTKKNKILPAKSENKKKVEDHPRTNKSR